jgi:hypothetical protein
MVISRDEGGNPWCEKYISPKVAMEMDPRKIYKPN